MADNKYTVTPTSVEGISQYERYSTEDTNLIESFEINSTFNSTKNIAELHVYSSGNTLLRSVTNYDRYSIGLNSGASKEGSTSFSVDPQQDAIYYGYENGGVKLLYLFLNNLFTELKQGLKLYIVEISNDRTELKLNSTGISNEDLKKYSLSLRDKIQDTSYFSEFRLNFGNNDLFIGINIDYNDDENVVTVKLYEPLPVAYTVKSTLDIVEFVANPLVYEIDAEFIPDAPRVPKLREANFNINLEENTATPSQFFNYDELFSFSVDNSNYQVLSLFNEKGAEISLDHTDYSDFIHFSSAEERLINFKYKLDLVKNYEASIANITTVGGSSGITSNHSYYQDLIKGVVDNFDHYERYLYFESGSYAWPKSNDTKPYINQASSTTEAITWFANQRTAANNFDTSNFNALTNTIPAFIREDENNAQYTLFIQMLAQHFDNLYIYAKAVSDKYDADNRINVGVSRDIVEEAIKSLGVKLYNSSKSLDNLFKYFVGEFQLDSGEVINTNVQAGQLISGGTTVTGLDNGFVGTSINPSNVQDYYGEGEGTYYTYFGWNTFSIQYFTTLNNNSSTTYSEEFTSSDGNLGELVYITLIDTSTDTVILDNKPYRYTDLNDYSMEEGYAYVKMRGPTENTQFRLHFTDAEGTDHSSTFASLDGSTTLKTVVRSSITVSEPAEQKDYQPTSQDIYQKSIYKRVYHNLPFLLKTKGTQRGLRALINCFGIPGDILKIKTYGGRDTAERPFFGDGQSYTNSNQKVRTDNTGSIIEGDTLSRYTSTIKTDDSYNQDLHNVEVGFSPTDNLDSLIQSTLGLDFTIDDYIGDPRDLTADTYNGLLQKIKTALAGVSERYDVKDFVRLIKFFDNVIFKMIKDFVPARSTTDTGIIIKPHLLDKSKAKSVAASVTQPEYSGSIDTAFVTGSNGGVYKSSASGSLRFDSDYAKLQADLVSGIPGESSTRHTDKFLSFFTTPLKSRQVKRWKSYSDHGQEESKYDGQLKNSNITLSTGELNDENFLKQIKYPFIGFDVFLYSEPPVDICLLTDNDETIVISIPEDELNQPYTLSISPELFPIDTANTEYYKNLVFNSDGSPANLNDNEVILYPNDEIIISNEDDTEFLQYEEHTIVGYDETLTSDDLELQTCAAERTFTVVRCRLRTVPISSPFHILTPYNLTNFFTGTNTNTQFTIKVDGEQVDPDNYIFNNAGTHTVSIEDTVDPDNCNASHTISVGSCPITTSTPQKYGVSPDWEFFAPNYFTMPDGVVPSAYGIRFLEHSDEEPEPIIVTQADLRNYYTMLDNEGFIRLKDGDVDLYDVEAGVPADGPLLLESMINPESLTAYFGDVAYVEFKAFLSEECQPITPRADINSITNQIEKIFTAKAKFVPWDGDYPQDLAQDIACGIENNTEEYELIDVFYKKYDDEVVGENYDMETSDPKQGTLEDFARNYSDILFLYRSKQGAIDDDYDEWGDEGAGWIGDYRVTSTTYGGTVYNSYNYVHSFSIIDGTLTEDFPYAEVMDYQYDSDDTVSGEIDEYTVGNHYKRC